MAGKRCVLLVLLRLAFTSGQTCEAGYENPNQCTPCVLGTYKENRGSEPCIPCPAGTSSFVLASVSSDQCIPVPKVMQVLPVYGPIAGGTRVEIHAGSDKQWNLTEVNLTGLPCPNITTSKIGVYTCITSPSTEPVSGDVELHFTSDAGKYPIKAGNFTYKENPVINTVVPNKTISAGGLPLTVNGTSFTSVAFPTLSVTVVVNQQIRGIVSSNCSVSNENMMICTTPNLFQYVPNVSSSRSISDATNNAYMFYAGFSLDGVTVYKNISGVIRDFTYLEVFSNPICDEENFIFERDTAINIKGKNMNLAVEKENINVTVGGIECDVLALATNVIVVMPPQTKPKSENIQTIIVTFGKGPLSYTIGTLDYGKQGGQWQVAVGVSLGVLGVLFIVIFAAVWLIGKRQKHKLSDIKRQLSTTTPNDYVPHRGGSVNEGYLSPTPSHSPAVELLDNRSSLASRSTASGHSAQSRPSLEDLQQRASLASLTLNLVKQRSESVGSSISSPPLSPTLPLSSIMENELVPAAPAIPMSSNMAYFLQPHKMSEVENELDVLVAQGSVVNKSRLQLAESIGKGFFGKVYKGLFFDENGENSTTVAVKTVQGIQFSKTDVAAFLHEAIIMKAFNHENVLALLAVVMDEGRPYVVLPFMEYGDLKSYVSDASQQFTVLQLLGFGVQVANGMVYLAEQKFVHRDLACRNCMVNEEMCIKIADFGLSRDVYYSQYYRVETKHRPLPVKWMAIESLTEGVFSTKTDVWSFGVLLWELMTRGCPPYADVDSYQIKSYLKSGRRLAKPEHATHQIYKLMLNCWKEAPDDRPTFEELQCQLVVVAENKEPDPDYLQLVE